MVQVVIFRLLGTFREKERGGQAGGREELDWL